MRTIYNMPNDKQFGSNVDSMMNTLIGLVILLR